MNTAVELNWQGMMIMAVSLISVTSLTIVCVVLLFRNRH